MLIKNKLKTLKKTKINKDKRNTRKAPLFTICSLFRITCRILNTYPVLWGKIEIMGQVGERDISVVFEF